MKAIKFLSMLVLAMALPVILSCSSDDEEPLESVIVGQWHSYKAVVSNSYGKSSFDVTQNGEYAAFYMEAIFSSDKTVLVKTWMENGQSYNWGEMKCAYTIDGNDLTIVPENSEKTVAKYYPKDKNIIWTMLIKDRTTGDLITTNLYFKK